MMNKYNPPAENVRFFTGSIAFYLSFFYVILVEICGQNDLFCEAMS